MTLTETNNEIRVAFCGNSILYFNDCPRVLRHMLKTHYDSVTEGTCLRGGTSLSQLWAQGNGMAEKFTSIRHDDDIGAPTVEELFKKKWDFCVMNDHTQGPLRDETKEETKQVISTKYAPLLGKTTIPVIMQTPAYRDSTIPYAKELSTVPFDEWTRRVREGCQEYAQLLSGSRVGPVGDAYQRVHSKEPELWNKLYFRDQFHPSPHGTWLIACVLYIVLTGRKPPQYDASVWKDCRYMQRPNEEPMALPTPQEATRLYHYACDTCAEHKIPFE